MKAVGGGTVARYLVAKGAPVFAQGAAKLSRLRTPISRRTTTAARS